MFAAWYWVRAELGCSDGVARTAILYYLLSNSDSKPEVTALVFDAGGNGVVCSDNAVGSESSPVTNCLRTDAPNCCYRRVNDWYHAESGFLGAWRRVLGGAFLSTTARRDYHIRWGGMDGCGNRNR